MDKRKGIILAIVLFLIIGLGTFVFAGGSDEGSGDGTITPQPDGGDNNDPTNPSDPTTEDDGNITEGEDKEDTTRPTGGNDNTDGDELVTDGEGENNPTTPTVDYKALLDELANMVESATSKEDLAEAEQFRKDNNITEENVAALDDAAASETYDEIIAILTDNASPVVTPDDLNGSFTNKDSVAVEITDTTDVSYTLTINGEEVTDADLANLTEEGNYELTVTDSAFNSTTITFTVDRTDPVLLVNDVEVKDGETIYVNEDAKMTVDETNLESFTSNGSDRTENVLNGSWTAQKDGAYNIVVTDKAGNETTYTIIVDKTAPVVNNGNLDGAYVNHSVSLYIDEKNDYTLTVTRDGNELVGYQDNMFELSHDGVYVVTVVDAAGNETTVKFTIDNTDPVLYVNDEKVEAGETIYVNEDAKMTVDETNLESFTSNGNDRTESILKGSWTAQNDGPYNIVVTDKAGNETSYTIVRDTVKIEVNHLYVLNNSHNDYEVSDDARYKVIGNGQDLYVEYVLKEEFSSTPVITIGGQEFEMNCGTASWDDSLYKCDAHITITEDMKLENGEVIPFTITGVKDIAGNETTVTEENVTVTEKYGQVIYDNEKPIYSSLGLVNITHYIEDSKGDNLFVANVGDTLRVMISFDELLEVNPTVTLGGVTKEMHFDDAWTDYSYWADIKITEDMNLTDGNIDFVISGYADAAGNVGVDLTSSDIKNSSYTGVELDTTAPAVKFPATHNYNKYYNNEFLTVTITEENLDEVYYTWGGSNKYSDATTLVPEELITDNEDGTYTVKVPTVEGRKKLSIKATDIAGNVYTGYSTSGWYNIDRTNPEITLYKWMDDGNHQVVEPSVHNYCVIAEATDTNLSKITLNGNEYNNGELICGNGQYELIATDKAGLTKPINFEIDTEYGSVIINGTDKYNTYDLETIHKYNKIESMTFSETGTVRLSLNDEVVYFGSTEEFNYTFVDGIYKVELFDKGGNPTVVMFELDSVAPQVVELRINSSNDDKGYANETHSVGIYLTVDEKLASDPIFTIDGKEYSKNQGDEDKNFYAVVTNLPETTTEGEIKFTIKVEDEFGNVATFTNKDIKNDVGYDKVIFDTTAPELTLVGKEETYDNILRIEADTEITLEDVLATATDASFDGEITVEPYEANFYANTGLKDDNIYGYDFSNGFDTRKPTGSRYNIYYKVTDKAGNTTEDVMILAISDTTAATITPNQDDNYHVEYGSEYSSVTATVTDNVDKTTTNYEPRVYIRYTYPSAEYNTGELYYNNTFNTTIPGYYLAIWDYTDSSGNISNTLKRWVIVSDTTAPVIEGVEDNSVYITSESMGYPTGGIVLKITDNSKYYTITFDDEEFYNVGDDTLVNTFRNGLPYHETLNGVDICAEDTYGNKSCVENVTIINIDEAGFESALANGGNVVLPENTTIQLNESVNVPSNTTIIGSSTSKIVGSLNLTGSNITLKDVNIENDNTTINISENAENIVIDGGAYTTNKTTSSNPQGQGTIRVGNVNGEAYTSPITIKNATLKGGIHLLNYNASVENITGNNITVENDATPKLVGILVVSDYEGYSQETVDYLNNQNLINMNYYDDLNQHYLTAIQDTDWADRYFVLVK